jgi:hypothetical protein
LSAAFIAGWKTLGRLLNDAQGQLGWSNRISSLDGHRQHTDKVIAHAEMIAFGFNVGIHDLIVKKLRGLPRQPDRHSLQTEYRDGWI